MIGEILKQQYNHQEVAKIFHNNRETIMGEYKIHLQPKSEHIPALVDKFTQLLARQPGLRDLIHTFKVEVGDGSSKEGETFPKLVIYPKLGRENMETVIATLYQELNVLDWMADGTTPRKNVSLSPLIHAAQSSADLKNILERFGILDVYFDKNKNYAFRHGEHPPKIKNNQKSDRQSVVLVEQWAKPTERHYANEKNRLDQSRLQLETIGQKLGWSEGKIDAQLATQCVEDVPEFPHDTNRLEDYEHQCLEVLLSPNNTLKLGIRLDPRYKTEAFNDIGTQYDTLLRPFARLMLEIEDLRSQLKQNLPTNRKNFVIERLEVLNARKDILWQSVIAQIRRRISRMKTV